MPSIAQQDYIVIDWGGLNESSISAERLAEIKAQLRTILEANSLTILSVVFKNYDAPGNYDRIIGVTVDKIGAFVNFYSSSNGKIMSINIRR